MYAVIGILKRPASATHEEFVTWWKEKHVPHVLNIPGVRHYAIYPIDAGYDVSADQWSGRAGADGVAIMYFDDRKTALTAFATEKGQADRANFVDWKMEADVFGGEVLVQRGLELN